MKFINIFKGDHFSIFNSGMNSETEIRLADECLRAIDRELLF